MTDPVTFLEENGERLGLFTGGAFMRLPLPPTKPLMGKWLIEESLTMLYAPRGLGKSQLMLGIALALAKGEDFLGYEVPEPVTVLYVDGEMSPRELQERLHLLGAGEVPDNLHVISIPSAFYPWGRLNEPDDQRELMEVIRILKPKVVILDNKSTLFPMARENDAETWLEVQDWFIRLRKMGLAIVLVHHAGKNGTQRGSSLHEVILNTVISLEPPPDGSSPTEGAKFVWRYVKNRHFFGEDAKPKLVSLQTIGGQATWHHADLPHHDERISKARELSAQNLTQRQIADQMGVGPATVNRWLNAG